MRIFEQRRLLATVLASFALAAGCGSSQTSSDADGATDPTESDEGTEIATSETSVARLNALLSDAHADSTEPRSLGGGLKPLDAPSVTAARFLPAGCATVQTGIVTEFHFAGCSAPGGLSDLNGTVKMRASASTPGARSFTFATVAFRMNGAAIDWESTVTATTTTAGISQFTSDSKLFGRTALGRAISRTSHGELQVQSAPACVVYNGSSEGTLGSRHLHMDVVNYKKCGVGCPAPGGEVRIRDVDTGAQTTLAFDGTNQATLTKSGGATEKAPLMCVAVEGGNATCDVDMRFGKKICHGTLDPTTLGPGISPVMSNNAAGQHYYCYPADASSYNGKVLYHLVGTADDPGVHNAWMGMACTLGFAAIAPMYENAHEIGSQCTVEKTVAGQSACILEGRRAILYGETPQPPMIEVTPADSIFNRTRTLLAALAQSETRFPEWSKIKEHFDAKDFGTFFVSGHSQGSGHALMFARDFAAQRLIMMGGAPDRVHVGTASNPAPDWISKFAASAPKTPVKSYYGFNNESDTIAVYNDVIANYDAIGLGSSACEHIGASTPAYPPSCRRVHIPAGCTNGFNAHGSMTVPSFGAAPVCTLGGVAHDNRPTWTFLLTNP